ncbi:MAG: ABC-F family ATP-binding cassette domain-containing protein [Chloroflexi bacterium]|nr:ABC-F family ATP-binding cassette domain-containing protein [Chloroflexota bacterium]
MSVLVANNLAKYFGGQDVFSGLSFQISRGDRIALVGTNGVGKTTLLRILAGLEMPTAGTVSVARGVRIGYLSQHPETSDTRTLWDDMLTVFEDLRAQQAELHRLEQDMADPQRRETAMKRYASLLTQFELAGGYTYEERIQRVLMGLGFGRNDWNKPLSNLSGGQLTRAQLGRLLLANPDLLLLDEPTNHLDLAATEWLENYLAQWPASLLVVAHDRYFLDKVANRVWELGFGQLDQYTGNYTAYVRQRAERIARRESEYEAQQKHIARTEEFIRRYQAGQRSREARGRQKRLEQMQRVERPQRAKTMALRLETRRRAGDNVLRLSGLVVGYDKPLFSCPDLLLSRGERVALLGPNGCGKTTFLKTILGEVPPLKGKVTLGANVLVGYFAQGHEDLHPERTILSELLEVKNLSIGEARHLLGHFLFSGDEVFKPIFALSGGERGRVALAKLAVLGANFLLLDEPTNHLDIPSQEVLEEVLKGFSGTILFVSHDRYFINGIATQVWLIEDNRLTAYEGDYSAFLERRTASVETQTGATERCTPRTRVSSAKGIERKEIVTRRKRITELESEILALEERLNALSEMLSAASAARDVDSLRELGMTYQAVEAELARRLEEWSIEETGSD